jgi:hypothetical protein
MPGISAPLQETLRLLAAAVAPCAVDDWWIIGSTAVLLHGGAVPHVKDVDLVMSARDAAALLERTGAGLELAAASAQFQSEVFGVWRTPPVPVEVMGGFRFVRPDGWRPVSFTTRQSVMAGGAALFVPSITELQDLLLAFGRPKDLARAAVLKGVAGQKTGPDA